MHAVRRTSLHNTTQSLRSATASRCRTYADNASPASSQDRRASAKLFADAANEEAELAAKAARASKLETLHTRHENWTGEESVQDAVLRMLVDKYKPLRSGPIRTADEKLKQAPPKVSSADSAAVEDDVELAGMLRGEPVVKTSWGAGVGPSLADVPLLPSVEGHQPWHTTFTVPSHARSSIKYGNIPPTPTSSRLPPNPELLDAKAKQKLRETKKRTEHAGRLRNARESTLDYRLGIKSAKSMHDHLRQRGAPNPTGLRGWAGLVEDRIEKARQEGRFDKIQGRGQPIKQFIEERNPFIAREEFLMNRIVQRQGAAPPWVEIQQELDTALNTFRDVVRQGWTRRAIRMLTLSRTPTSLTSLTLDQISAFRDKEWEARERAYHNTALEEVNSLVRKYNAMAPYAVRRGHYALEPELDRAYRQSAEDILAGIAERVKAGVAGQPKSGGAVWDDDERGQSQAQVDASWAPARIRDVIREWVGMLVKR